MTEVHRFFEKRHAGHYRLYDLRAEKGSAYDPDKFGGKERVARYPFFDHNPAPLSVIRACIEDMHTFMTADPANVVAVHCKAGKGRTGLIISAYLVYAGMAPTATAALRMFGAVRTHNSKGVTIPSQMRYVHYFEASLKRPVVPATYRLRHFRMHTVPNFDVGGGCDPYFDVRLGDGKQLIFDWKAACKGKVKNYKPKHRIVDFDLWPHNIRVRGDVKIVFYDWDQFSAPDKMFHFWFSTAFVENNYLLFHKDVLDRACKDKACKEFEPDFKLELFLDKVEDDADGAEMKTLDYLDADNDEDLAEAEDD